MADGMTYEINLNGTTELFRKLNNAVQKEVINESLQKGGILLSGWSKKNRLSGPRPKFLGVKTGRLRSSISSSKTQKTGNTYFVKVGTNVVYGPTHEFGSPRKNIPARPFLSPALEDQNNRKDILSILVKNINEALEKK